LIIDDVISENSNSNSNSDMVIDINNVTTCEDKSDIGDSEINDSSNGGDTNKINNNMPSTLDIDQSKTYDIISNKINKNICDIRQKLGDTKFKNVRDVIAAPVPLSVPVPKSKSVVNDDNKSDEISQFLSRIQNKYSGNAEQKHLNQLYDIGIMCVNKKFNHQKLTQKLAKIIDERSCDPLKTVRDSKRDALISAFKQGILDGLSDEYRLAYDNSNTYQYDSEKLKKRAHMDFLLKSF
jgi:hypothetical protein